MAAGNCDMIGCDNKHSGNLILRLQLCGQEQGISRDAAEAQVGVI